jgi:hypothetical protein
MIMSNMIMGHLGKLNFFQSSPCNHRGCSGRHRLPLQLIEVPYGQFNIGRKLDRFEQEIGKRARVNFRARGDR